MDKSVINLLQEISIKQGFVPIYNFMEKKLHGNITQFTCIVSCKELNACDIGNSKKEAKNNAAKKMLSLLDENNTISQPEDTILSSMSIANKIQSSTKDVYKTSPSNEDLIVDRNYIGLLQEFCQQQKISTKDILYELLYEEGLSHLKSFTIEVSVGSLGRERATAQCKKIAKQMAAKKLFLHLNPNTDNSNTADDQKKLENSVQNYGTGIFNCMKINEEILSIEKLNENAKSFYLDHKYEKAKTVDRFAINDFHTLFEKNYFSKVQYSKIIQDMQTIRDRYTVQIDFMQIRQKIESSFQVKIQKITMQSITKNHIICLCLLSNPRVTQIGMGETKFIAESRAMYNLITTILTLLNI